MAELLAGSVALVTGASSGIGRGIVELFAQEQAKVVVAATTVQKAQVVVDQIISTGGDAIAVAVDIADKNSVDQMYAAIANQYGGVDILVNNAGYFDKFAPSLEADETLWDKVFDTDMKGTYLVTNGALTHMLKQQAGVIVNIGSVASHFAKFGGAAYIAAKHAMVGYTKQLAYDYGKHGIRANIICPGIIDTKFFTENVSSDQEEATRVQTQELPARRIGQPDDIAKAALFLASADSAYIYGSSLMVDGGLTL